MLKATEALPEYTIKAAYLYNFALLTDWPENKRTGDFNLCLYGKEGFGSAIYALEGKTMGDQIIKISVLLENDDVSNCHIVFLGKTDQQKEQKLLHEITTLPILLVTDNVKMSYYHILIVQENEKLAFTIDTKALKESHLNLSSRLLNLAKKETP
jgi:hypothetical protein